MNYLVIITFLIIIACFALICLNYIFANKAVRSRRYKITICIILFLCITLISMAQNPPYSFDLFRHYEQINDIRRMDLTATLDLFINRYDIVGWNIVLKAISTVTSFNGALFIVTNAIVFGIFLYLLMRESHRLTDKQFWLSVLLFFALISAPHLMSGVRNSFAISVFALAFYMDIFLKKRYLPALLYVLSAIIHPGALVVLFIRLIAKTLERFKYSEILLVLIYPLLFISMQVIDVFINLEKSPYTRALYSQLMLKANTVFDWKITPIEIALFVVSSVVIFCIYKSGRASGAASKLSSSDRNFVVIIYYLMFLIIGFVPLFDLFTRTKFFIAFTMPFIFVIYNKQKMQGKVGVYFNLLFPLAIYVVLYYSYYMLKNGRFY